MILSLYFYLRKWWWGFVYFVLLVSRTRWGAAAASMRDCDLRPRLVTSRGSPYPSRSPRAHPSGWTRTQLGLRLRLGRLVTLI